MLKHLLLPLGLASSCGALAQPSCPPALVQVVLPGGEVVPAAGAPMQGLITLQVVPNPECPGAAAFRFRNAEYTLVRNGRPVLPTFNLRQPQADLRPIMRAARPGDQVHVFIAYQNLGIVAADGRVQLYQPPAPPTDKRGQVDLIPDAAKGISFNWKLLAR
ncbi:hypothetical protein [Hymenobacter sp. B81]|uniref:hypothetical protein n=1 Tax=Hymenobacter sp. B81 TaxID=3344878 RepID=UPI0037DD2D4D